MKIKRSRNENHKSFILEVNFESTDLKGAGPVAGSKVIKSKGVTIFSVLQNENVLPKFNKYNGPKEMATSS